jgi:ring-1,2-phenylacetyl-CoA epoxidase subunit PaaC
MTVPSAASGPHREAEGNADRLVLFAYILGLADDPLVLGHRLSQWSGRGPMLEEDIALSNLALDLIGQARLLYAYAGEVEGEGRDEDQLAYLRDEHAYANVLLVEQPNGDFAKTMMRQLLYAAFMHPYYQALTGSRDVRLAEIAAKAVKEMAYHVRHAAEWVIRLGDGTEQSHVRAAAALDELWMYTGELFGMHDGERALAAAGVAVDREAIRPKWSATIDTVLRQATLRRPADGWMQTGGRAGRHSEHLGPMLAEMQVLHRAHPGVTW